MREKNFYAPESIASCARNHWAIASFYPEKAVFSALLRPMAKAAAFFAADVQAAPAIILQRAGASRA
jgi:hypothetical protein